MRQIETIAFQASATDIARAARDKMVAAYGDADPKEADVIVALGGDGFMLEALHGSMQLDAPVYGINCGTIGFLMNELVEEGLIDRLRLAEEAVINPLAMRAETAGGDTHEDLAINEVSLLRQGPQAAKLQISIDGKVRLDELVCDGALLSTPAGSTAYNYSAHGPILPIRSEVLALTAVAAFRPRRWRGAILPKGAAVRFDVLGIPKRPVMAEADGRSVRDVISVEIRSEPDVEHRILFDPGHGLEERLISEQFV
jgi:NAD+ kinase